MDKHYGGSMCFIHGIFVYLHMADYYKIFIHDLAKNGIDKAFLNSDSEKMKTVYIEMLNHSEKEFRIFAGLLCNEVTSSQEYINAMSSFVERNGVLRILLNQYKEDNIKESSLFKRLAYYKSCGYDIIVKETDDKPYINLNGREVKVHVAIGDKKSYRLEFDTENRRAMCNMNNTGKAAEFADFFDKCFNESYTEEIDLIQLFEMQAENGNK